MGDYEVHTLWVNANDDLVSILSNITSNTEVVLREGTHAAATQIVIPGGLTNVTVRGSKASVLNITYNGDNPIAITAPASDITFEGFSVTYNGSAGGQTPLFAPIGSGGQDIYRLVVRNIHAEFLTGSITFVRWDGEDIDVYGLTIEGCKIYGATPKGILRMQMAANRELKRVQILGNEYHATTSAGANILGFYGASGALVEDVLIEGNVTKNGQEALWFDFSNGTLQKVVVTGNTFAYLALGNAGCVFSGSDISHVTITDNIFDRTGNSYCLNIASGSYYNVSDNTFMNSPSEGLIVGSAVTDSTFDNNTAANCVDEGIEINGSNNRISNNVSEGNDYGIREITGASGNHYVGNTCRNNATADKLLEGSNRRQGVNYW